MEEKSFKKISIQEITDTAGYQDRLFYTNLKQRKIYKNHVFVKLFEILDIQDEKDKPIFKVF